LLMIMIRKSLFWCILIMLVTISVSLLYLRYTLPTYEVSGALIVKPNNTAQALNIESGLLQGKNSNLDIEKDIQLMKSSVILDHVIDSLQLQVSYYFAGNILDEELYPNHPFNVQVDSVGNTIADHQVRLRILSNQKFEMDFSGKGDSWKTYDFDRSYQLPDFKFIIHLNQNHTSRNFDAGDKSEYFFIVHSMASLNASLRSTLMIAPSLPTVGMVMR